MKKLALILVMVLFTGLINGFSQKKIRVAELGFPISDFTLPSLQGENVSISDFKGKNILLVFPRGRVQDTNTWCNICMYQYADFSDLVLNRDIQKKYKLQIIYVLPYNRAVVQQWVQDFPEKLQELEGWKNPPDSLKNDPGTMAWAEKARKILPKTFSFEKGKVPTPIPILIDADRTVSKGFDLFRTEWNGSKVDQNQPAVYIIDAQGIVRYKYISQKTTDRPSAEYLLKVLQSDLMKE
jgi:peroxiredoxin